MKRLRSSTGGVLLVGGLLTLCFAAFLLFRGLRQFPPNPRWTVEGGDARRGRAALEQYGCGSCHVIPGIRHAIGRVGPQLTDLGIQTYVAGVLPNTPENLVRWIREPRHVNPHTAMPNLGVGEQEAADMAAYLYERTRR